MLLNPVPLLKDRLYHSDTFTFACHEKLACFNLCCRNKFIPLMPYDVLRLKNFLHIHSDDFLAQYALYNLDKDTGFPIISLKMMDDEHKICPFVSLKGCKVYKDRPTACRLYPLGRASGFKEDGITKDEVFFRMDTPACLGVKEKNLKKIADWLDEQGLNIYIKFNNKMRNIVFHPKRNKERPLDDQQVKKIMVACYNLDIFKDFVLNPEFIKTYNINKDNRIKISKDDTALLLLGLDYLNTTLFTNQ